MFGSSQTHQLIAEFFRSGLRLFQTLCLEIMAKLVQSFQHEVDVNLLTTML